MRFAPSVSVIYGIYDRHMILPNAIREGKYFILLVSGYNTPDVPPLVSHFPKNKGGGTSGSFKNQMI